MSFLYVLVFKRSYVAQMFFAPQPPFCSAGLSFALCSFGYSSFYLFFLFTRVRLAKENLRINKDNRVFMSRNYRSDLKSLKLVMF